MIIKTIEDWESLAADVIPLLMEYTQEFGSTRWYDEEVALELFNSKEYKKLHQLFEKIWGDLPDRGDIRHRPFFDLCDLCSESWVLYE